MWTVLFLLMTGAAQAAQQQPTSCEKHIADAICIVDPPPAGGTIRDRQCKNVDKSKYVAAFTDLYRQRLSPVYRSALCSLQNLYIETDPNYFHYYGYTWFHDVSDLDDLKGAYIRFGQKKLDHILNGEETFSSIYRDDINAQFVAPLSIDDLEIRAEGFNALAYLVAHELTHAIDLYNHLNSIALATCARQIIQPDGFHSAKCNLTPASYSNFSWKDTVTKKSATPEAAWLLARIYGDKPVFEAEYMTRFLQVFYGETNFISPYATVDPWEDLADTVGILNAYWTANPRGPLLIVQTSDEGEERSFNVMRKSAPILGKLEYASRLILGQIPVRLPLPAK